MNAPRLFSPAPILAALVALLAASAVAEQSPRKSGGFQGSTPKPATKKTGSSESAGTKARSGKPAAGGAESSTPAPKSKPASEESVDPPPKSASKAPATPSPGKPAKTYDAEDNGPAKPKREYGPSATVAPEAIAEFAAQPPRIQALITAALELTRLNLTYTYGSADPAQGGMDCSGAIFHLLNSQGFKGVPRDSSGQYAWVRKAQPFFAVVSKREDSFEFADLRPGDLLFWTGTYETGRELPISHVMLYLGTEKATRRRIMFGSSDGRSYAGVARNGVSVFDFKMPRVDPAQPDKAKVDFVGYGRIPGVRDEAPEVTVAAKPSETQPEPPAKPAPAPGGSTTRKKASSTKKPAKRE